MRILFISPRQGWPPVSGAKIREYHFARAAGECFRLTYAFFRESMFDAPGHKELPFCEKIVAVPAPRAYSAGRLIRGIAGRWPLPVLNYTSPEMATVIRQLAAENPFDAVHLDGVHLAAYAPLVRSLMPQAKVFFNWHNIESEGMKRYAELTSSPLKSAYARLTARRLAGVEKNLLVSGYGNVVCSAREREQLQSAHPDARIAVIENGVDTEYFEAVRRAAGERHRILFVGLMAYHANVDAIVWFVRHIWPGVRELFPGKVLTIVGAKPVDAVLALRSEPAVEVTGTVDDVRPYYAEAFAAIAPLRTGAGTRLKILEAMAAGAPVVSTAIGAEGLDVANGRDFLLAETVEDWKGAFSRLQNEEYRNMLVQNGGSVVRSRYDWRMLRQVLCDTYRQWMSESAQVSGRG